jgi:hypothetical protein
VCEYHVDQRTDVSVMLLLFEDSSVRGLGSQRANTAMCVRTADDDKYSKYYHIFEGIEKLLGVGSTARGRNRAPLLTVWH